MTTKTTDVFVDTVYNSFVILYFRENPLLQKQTGPQLIDSNVKALSQDVINVLHCGSIQPASLRLGSLRVHVLLDGGGEQVDTTGSDAVRHCSSVSISCSAQGVTECTAAAWLHQCSCVYRRRCTRHATTCVALVPHVIYVKWNFSQQLCQVLKLKYVVTVSMLHRFGMELRHFVNSPFTATRIYWGSETKRWHTQDKSMVQQNAWNNHWQTSN